MVRVKEPAAIPPLENVYMDLLVGLREGDEHPPARLAELEAAWWAYRDEIMADYGDRDWKPAGWEMFEGSLSRPR